MKNKKVFFILDWDFAYIFSPIANELVKKGIASKDINCLNVGRNYYKYLTDGTIKHPFKIIYSLDEVYEMKIYNKTSFNEKEKNILRGKIRRIEKKYIEFGSCWKYVWADRNHIKEDYYNILHKLVVFFEYFENLYSEENPDLIITNAYASMPHLISYVVANKLNIRIVNPELLRIEKKTFLSSSRYKLLDVINTEVSDLTMEKARKVIEDYRVNFDKPFYEKSNEKRKRDIFGGIRRLLNYSYNYYITKLYTGHTKPSPFCKLLNSEIKPRLNKLYFNKFYNFDRNIDNNEKYIYFPLHLQPEATTMTNAPMYINQLFVIETLSKSIPIDYRLYIKEHPNMFGNNTKYFYDQIKKLPNVRLFHPSVNSKEMIKNCEAVVTITGTVGLEGLILKKPVFTLGEVFYNDCPLVTQLQDIAITKWFDKIKHVLENYQYDEEILAKFIATVLEQSYDMLIVEPGYFKETLDKKNMNNILKAIEDNL